MQVDTLPFQMQLTRDFVKETAMLPQLMFCYKGQGSIRNYHFTTTVQSRLRNESGDIHEKTNKVLLRILLRMFMTCAKTSIFSPQKQETNCIVMLHSSPAI